VADIKVVVDSSDLQLLKRELIDIPKKAKDSASVFEREFKKVETRLNNTAKKSQEYYNQVLKVDNAHKSAAQSASVFEKEITRESQALDSLRRSIDPVYAAKQRTIQVTQSLRAAVRNEQMSVEEAANTLRLYRQQLKLTNEVQMAATKASNRFGVVTQQAGYQVSDFIVQVQSGTNPFIAFSQQASQLAGVLPLVATQLGITTTAAIALSATLGIAIPLVGAIGAAYLVSRQNAKEAESGTDAFARALENARNKSAELRQELKMLSGGYKDAAESAFANAVELAKAEVAKKEASLGSARGVAKVGAETSLEKAQKALDLAENELEQYKTRRTFLDKEREAFGDILGSSEGIKQSQEALNSIYASRLGTIDTTANTYVDILGSAQGLADTEQALNEIFASRLGTIDDTANNYVDILGSSKGLKQSEEALNKIFESRLGTIDTLANTYKDVLGSSQGLQEALTALLELEEARAIAVAEGLVGGLDRQIERANEFYDVSKTEQKELNDLAAELGIRLGNGFADALVLIKQAKKEATIGLDAFGGYGEFKYGIASTFKSKTKKTRSKQDPLGDLQKQLDLENRMLGQTEARKRIIQALGDTYSKTSSATISDLEKQINSINQAKQAEEERNRVLEAAKQRQQEVADTISSSMENAFMSIVDGTKSVQDAFRVMAAEIIKELYRIFVVKKITGMISDVVGLYTGAPVGQMSFNANGNVFNRGSIVPYANGGVVGGPTYFPMSGGKTGLMGEAGPEAIMPLKRGKDGKLGVAADGGSGVTINQTFAFQANGDDSVKKIIAQAAPKIAAMTQQQIMDSRRRGGQMKQVFG
jgi:lambda family phage tail tape measure protein